MGLHVAISPTLCTIEAYFDIIDRVGGLNCANGQMPGTDFSLRLKVNKGFCWV
jgi:hypothetical protein